MSDNHERAIARARQEKAERERRPIDRTNETYTNGAAVVRAALEEARKR